MHFSWSDASRTHLRSIVFVLSMTLLPIGSRDAHGGGADEIQVYTDSINAPGAFGLELHANYVPVGITQAAYGGDLPTHDTFRETSEFSYGVNERWELGAYLPYMERPGQSYVEGGKLRLKFLDHAGENIFYGVNTEVGRISKRSVPNPWNMDGSHGRVDGENDRRPAHQPVDRSDRMIRAGIGGRIDRALFR